MKRKVPNPAAVPKAPLARNDCEIPTVSYPFAARRRESGGSSASEYLKDNFTIQLFNDAGGVPATTPFLSLPVSPSRVDTGNNAAGSDIFAYDVNISPVTLAANTTFWLSIFNNTSNDTNDNWFWGMVDLAGNGATRDGLGLAWSPSVGNNGYQFQLTGVPLPEPSALALLGLGFIAIALLNRRRTPST